jgi:hypothetical protein
VHGTGASLQWLPNDEEDLQYYKIYRGDSPGFEVNPEHPIHVTTDTEWFDDTGDPGNYYRVSAVDFAGNEGPATDPRLITGTTPSRRFRLEQNDPNPFNPSTLIRFVVPESGPVELVVYDLAGRRVKTLVSRDLDAGEHDARWHGRDDDGRRVASGVYVYRLVAGDRVESKQAILLK